MPLARTTKKPSSPFREEGMDQGARSRILLSLAQDGCRRLAHSADGDPDAQDGDDPPVTDKADFNRTAVNPANDDAKTASQTIEQIADAADLAGHDQPGQQADEIQTDDAANETAQEVKVASARERYAYPQQSRNDPRQKADLRDALEVHVLTSLARSIVQVMMR